MAARMDFRGDAAFVDATERLFELSVMGGDSSIRQYDVHPSGERFLVPIPIGDTNEMREISVRLGWAASLGASEE